jgi:hypothetical protein
MRVLRASGVESEARVSFSALHQLLYPLRHNLGMLDDRGRDTPQRVFHLAPGPSKDPLVSLTVLTLLGAVSTERPLLVVADDLQWFDPASAAVLGFVACRIAEVPIVFLGTARPETEGCFHRIGLPEHTVKPLGKEPAAKLLDARWPGLARSTGGAADHVAACEVDRPVMRGRLIPPRARLTPRRPGRRRR